jgi:hypothetical protein
MFNLLRISSLHDGGDLWTQGSMSQVHSEIKVNFKEYQMYLL